MSRGSDQHKSGRRSRFAHRVVIRADRVRSICVLVAVSFVANGLLDLYALPIRVQFISDDQGQRRTASGAHLRTMGHDPHCAVRIDAQVNAGMQYGAIRIRVVRKLVARRKLRIIMDAQHKCACRDSAASQKLTPADVGDRIHAVASAAALIAARIRW